MLLRRIVVLLLVVLTIVPAALAAVPASVSAQTGSDDDIFQTYLAQVEGVGPEAGPIDGLLSLEESGENAVALGVSLADLLVQVEFEVPDVPDGATWAAAVAFRQTDTGFHYLVLWPDGTWSFAPFGGGSVQTGDGIPIETAGGLIQLSIAAAGEQAYFGVNDQYIATLDVSSSLEAGDVTVSANLIGNPDAGSTSLAFQGLAAWELLATDSTAGSPVASPAAATETPAVGSPAATETPAAAQPATTETPVAALPAATETPAVAQPEATATPAVQETAVAPAADDEAAFNSYLQQSLSSPILYGPENGTVAHQPDAVSFYETGVEAVDFIARVECLAGRSAAEGFWDCGFVFRGGEGTQYRLAYVSDGYWFLSQGPEQPMITGTDGPVSATADSKVVLNLIAIGDKGYFGINDQFISALDLSAITTPGRVELASAFFTDTYIENGGVDFEDFIIWSLDDGTVQPSPTAGSTGAELTPTAEIGTATTTAVETPSPEGTQSADLVGVTGNSYTSPTWGYTLTWPTTWTVDSSTSDGTMDLLGISNEAVLVDLIGEPWNLADGSCFDRLVQFYQGDAQYSEIQGAVDSASAAPGVWETTGIITMTYTNDQGEATPYVNYAACSVVPGQQAIVTLEQFVPIADFSTHVAAMDELRLGFTIGGDIGLPAETTTPIAPPSPEPTVAGPTPTTGVSEPTATAVTGVGAETPTTTASQTGNVAGNTYTSPTFGYSLTWDDTWSVVADEASEGIDFLRIATDTLTADLYAAASSNNPQQCIDELLNFYVNDELYANAAFATGPDGQPIIEDFGSYVHAVISYTQTQTDGSTIEQFSEATCFRLEDEGAVVILEVYMHPTDFVLQRGAISALQEALVIPGQPQVQTTEVAQTPIAGATEEPGTPVTPPEVESAQSATFFLTAVNNSGVQGTGTIEALPRMVIVTAIVLGGQPGDTVTIQRGDCATIGSGAEPDYIVGELDESGLLREELRVRLTALMGEPYSVVVYPSGDDFTQALSCGEIS